MRRRGNISLKLLAQLMVKGGFDHIITVDLHSKESLGFFDCAVDNLRASPFLIQYIQDCVSSAVSRFWMPQSEFIFFHFLGKMVTRGSIVCKLLASLMTRAGLSHIITVDLWQKEIQGFFDCPVDNLRAQSFLLKYIQHSVSKGLCRRDRSDRIKVACTRHSLLLAWDPWFSLVSETKTKLILNLTFKKTLDF